MLNVLIVSQIMVTTATHNYVCIFLFNAVAFHIMGSLKLTNFENNEYHIQVLLCWFYVLNISIIQSVCHLLHSEIHPKNSLITTLFKIDCS